MHISVNNERGVQRKHEARHWVRIALLPVLIALGVAAIVLFHLDRYFSFEALAANRTWLLLQVAQAPVLTALIFAAIYIAVTTFSLPGTSILTMAGGFLFGLYAATAIIVAAATIGATFLFLIARTSFGEFLRGRALGALQTLKDGFRKDALNYLLFLRLVPLFPFWLINLVAAFLDVPLPTFVIGTLLGIIPGTAVYASVGSGLGAILNRGQKPDLGVLLSPEILFPILALAVLSLVPIGYRRLRHATRH